MTANLESRVFDILHELTAVPIDQIKLTDRLREDLNMDSISSMELISMLDEEYEVEVELEDAMAIKDVKGVVALLSKHLEA